MSINYNAIVGNKSRVTLPSVEAWGTNNNILRDPPKSIMTRRIDKVNQDGSINDMMYESGDRFAENINVYARGVNPMVSVQYTNANGAPVKQPYRIIRDGAFRPPILTQEQLLPLSRQPRNKTQVITNKAFIDYTKRVTCPAPDSARYFKDLPIKGAVIPNKYIKIEVPVKEHFVINYINENPIMSSANTNMSAKGNIQLENQIGQAMKDAIQYAHSTNPNGIEQQNYIHDDIQLRRNTPMTSAVSSRSAHVNVINTPDIDLQLNRNTPMTSAVSFKSAHVNVINTPDIDLKLSRNTPMTSAVSSKSANINVINSPDVDIILSKNIPEYKIASSFVSNVTRISEDHNTNYELQPKLTAKSVVTNKTDINGTNNFTRTVRLAPSLQQGGYAGSQGIPMVNRDTQYNPNYTTGKTRLAQRIQQIAH